MGPIDATAEPRLAEVEDSSNDDIDFEAVAGKVMVYLKDIVTTEQLDAVQAILGGVEPEDADEVAGEAKKEASARDRARRQASDRGLAGREARRLAQDAEFDRLFPTAKSLLRR